MLEHEGRTLSPQEMADYWAELAAKYPIVSIEDGMDEEDWDGWKLLTDTIGDKVQLVGDDLFVTNPVRLRRGIELGVGNSILVKVNQIGTLSRDARGDPHRPRGGLHARSSRTARGRPRTRRSPTSPSPPAPARSRPARPSRSDRVAKYNRLLRIEEELGGAAEFPGLNAFVQRAS